MSRTAWVAPDGVRYAWTRDGAGAPLVLIHGFTGAASAWDDLVPGLARTLTVLRPDLLGHGASDAPADPARHAVARQAADLAAALADTGLPPVHLAGYSLGARVALRLALDAPERVASLFLESPSAGIADPAARAVRAADDAARADRLEARGIADFVDAWEALPIFAAERALPAEVRARIRAGRLACDPAGLAASLRGAGQGVSPAVHGEIGRLRLPVTVLAGALDPTGAARAREVAAAIPGARLVVLPDAGHAPHRETPAAWLRALATHCVRSTAACVADGCAVHVPDDRPIPAPIPHRSPA